MSNALAAYAVRQQRIWSRRIDIFLEAWVPALDAAKIGQDWLAAYRDRHNRAIAAKTRKSQHTVVPLVETVVAVDQHPAPAQVDDDDTAQDVLSYAEDGMWDQQRVDTWVPSGEPADDDDDDDDSDDGASSGADED
jgi:hypothetical protein